MKEYKIVINTTAGIDAQLAQKVVGVASEYAADMILRYQDKEVDLKSILGIMSLAVIKDANVEIIAVGDDAAAGIKAVEQVLKQGGIN